MKKPTAFRNATEIFAAHYIRTFIPGGMVFFRGHAAGDAAGQGNNAQGGMRGVFPPYALRAIAKRSLY